MLKLLTGWESSLIKNSVVVWSIPLGDKFSDLFISIGSWALITSKLSLWTTFRISPLDSLLSEITEALSCKLSSCIFSSVSDLVWVYSSMVLSAKAIKILFGTSMNSSSDSCPCIFRLDWSLLALSYTIELLKEYAVVFSSMGGAQFIPWSSQVGGGCLFV